jgi:hypothetical protein
MARIGLLACILLIGAATATAAPEPPSIDKRPTATWWGEIGNPKLESARPVTGIVTTQADFEKLWKAWRGEEKVPIVDFKTSFVAIRTWLRDKKSKFVAGTKGVSIFLMNLDSDGEAKLRFGPAVGVSAPNDPPEKWEATKGFYYGLAVFPRAGVKKVDGKELPAP